MCEGETEEEEGHGGRGVVTGARRRKGKGKGRKDRTKDRRTHEIRQRQVGVKHIRRVRVQPRRVLVHRLTLRRIREGAVGGDEVEDGIGPEVGGDDGLRNGESGGEGG